MDLNPLEGFEKAMKEALLDDATQLEAIIKGHYSIDLLLDRMIFELVMHKDSLAAHRMAFLLKVDLLISFGVLSKDFRPVLEKLNSVRNKFAHNPYYVVSVNEAQAIRNTVKSNIGRYLPRSFSNFDTPTSLLRVVLAVCLVNVKVSYRNFCYRKCSSLASEQMINDSAFGVRHDRFSGMDVDKEFSARADELMKEHYPWFYS